MLSFRRYRLQNFLGDEGGDAGGGAGGDKGGDAAAEAAAETAKTADVDWTALRQALPEDLRDDKSLLTINSVEGLAKSFVHSQRAIGSKVSVPDKHATPEDWQVFFNKAGNPEKLEDYKLNLPEGVEADEGFMTSIKEEAHKAGVLPWQMEKILGNYYAYADKMLGAQSTDNQAKMEDDLNGLKKEWGESYEDKQRASNVAFKELLPDPAHRQRLIDDGLANHPSVARLLANASKMFSEDKFIGHGDGKLGGLSPAEALAKANDIQGNNEHPYRDTKHPGHKAAQEEVQNLYKIAYPE